MDAPLFGGEVEFPNTASGSVPAPAFESSAPDPTTASAPTAPGDDASAWSNTWRDDVAAETARTSPRNRGVGGMPTDAEGASHPAGTPVSSRTGVFTDPLRSLPGDPAAMLAALQAEDDDTLRAGGPHALAEQLLALQRLRDMLEAEQLRRVTAFDAVDGAQAVRCRSTKGFLRTHGQLTGASAGRLTARAAQLDAVPAVRTAQAAGTLGADQAAVIARHLAPVPDPGERARAEELLLAHAPALHLTQLARAAQELRARLTDQEHPGDTDTVPQPFQSWVRLSPTGTTDAPFWVLSGELNALAGEKLRIALEAAAGAPSAQDPRSHPERTGDALEAVTDLALGTDRLPTTGTRRPHLTLVADLDTLRSLPLPGDCPRHHGQQPLPGTAGETGNLVRLPAQRAGSRPQAAPDDLAALLAAPHGAFTERGLRLDGARARAVACDCTLRVLLTDAQGRPLSVGRATRTVPPHIRDAVTARDRHCVWPGCDRPPSWCEGHHAIHWADGGPTSVDNIALLCREHHQELHATGWELTRRPDGHHTVRPPLHTHHPSNTRWPQAA